MKIKLEERWKQHEDIHLQVKRNLKSPTYKSSNNNYSCINIQHATSIIVIHLIVLSHIKKLGKTGINIFMPEHKVWYLLVHELCSRLKEMIQPFEWLQSTTWIIEFSTKSLQWFQKAIPFVFMHFFAYFFFFSLRSFPYFPVILKGCWPLHYGSLVGFPLPLMGKPLQK